MSGNLELCYNTETFVDFTSTDLLNGRSVSESRYPDIDITNSNHQRCCTVSKKVLGISVCVMFIICVSLGSSIIFLLNIQTMSQTTSSTTIMRSQESEILSTSLPDREWTMPNSHCISCVLDHSLMEDNNMPLKWKPSDDNYNLGCNGVGYANGTFDIRKTGNYHIYSKLSLSSREIFDIRGARTMESYQHCVVNGETAVDCDNGRMVSGEHKNSDVNIPMVYLEEGQQIKVTMSRTDLIITFPKCNFMIRMIT